MLLIIYRGWLQSRKDVCPRDRGDEDNPGDEDDEDDEEVVMRGGHVDDNDDDGQCWRDE